MNTPMLLPPEILTDLGQLPGFDLDSFHTAHRQAPPTSIRLNPAKAVPIDTNGVVLWCPTGRYISGRPVFTLDPMYHAGAYYVQEASSMFLQQAIKHVAEGKKGMRILDLCAAPGGKSTLLVAAIDSDSLLVSNEVIRTRSSILDENLTRWGYSNNFVTSSDPSAFRSLTGYFDVIVVDAPCSGSGLFRKDPDALGHWSPDNVELCGQRQERILADVLPALKQGGSLIYATCSFSLREDEQILDWLNANFHMESVSIPRSADWKIREVVTTNNMKGYRFIPGEVQGEGFFLAVLTKTAPSPAVKIPHFRSAHDKKAQLQSAHLVNQPGTVIIRTDPENFSVLQANHESDLALLQKYLYFRKAGTRLGDSAGKDWIPAHDVALSILRSEQLPVLDLSRDEALLFLKKMDFPVPPGARGWHVVTCAGLGLGWVKLLGNRMNNYLPKHWMIRMDLPGM